MERNEVSLTGVVVDVHELRMSPAGVAHQRWLLQHRSKQVEASQPREVVCRIWVEARGQLVADVDALCGGLAINQRLEITGFLARSSASDHEGTQLVLHASHVKRLT